MNSRRHLIGSYWTCILKLDDDVSQGQIRNTTATTVSFICMTITRRGLRHHRQIDRYRDSKHRLLLTAAHKGIFFLLYFHTQQIKVETPNVT